MKHTTTKWEIYDKVGLHETAIVAGDKFICEVKHYSKDDEPFKRWFNKYTDPTNEEGIANAERIVACVNACDGVSNNKLAAHPYAELQATIDECYQMAEGLLKFKLQPYASQTLVDAERIAKNRDYLNAIKYGIEDDGN